MVVLLSALLRVLFLDHPTFVGLGVAGLKSTSTLYKTFEETKAHKLFSKK